MFCLHHDSLGVSRYRHGWAHADMRAGAAEVDAKNLAAELEASRSNADAVCEDLQVWPCMSQTADYCD